MFVYSKFGAKVLKLRVISGGSCWKIIYVSHRLWPLNTGEYRVYQNTNLLYLLSKKMTQCWTREVGLQVEFILKNSRLSDVTQKL